MTLAGLPARFGGAGALARHYRFGVIPVGSRAGGMVPCNTGGDATTHVVEDAAWVDVTFATSLSLSEGNVSVNIEDQSIIFRDATSGAELARIQYDETLQGLTASELMAKVAYRGEWALGGIWGSPAVITSGGGPSKMIKVQSGASFLMYVNGSAKLVNRYHFTSWSSESTTVIDAPDAFDFIELSDKRFLLLYVEATTDNLMLKIRSSAGVWGTSVIVDSAVNYGKVSICQLSTGQVLAIYTRAGGTTLYYRLYDPAAGTWTTEVSTGLTTADSPNLAITAAGTLWLAYLSSGTLYARTITSVTSSAISFGTATSINTSSGPGFLLALPDSRVAIFYAGSSTTITWKVYNGTWGSASTIVTGTPFQYVVPTACMKADGKILVAVVDGVSAQMKSIFDDSANSLIPYEDSFAFAGSGVVETGSNSNGTYIKFGDGTLICHGSITTAALTSVNDSNIGTYGWSFCYIGNTTTFPAAFIAPPVVVGNVETGISNAQSITTTQFNFVAYAHSSLARSAYYMAIGRWK
jgi:hypothetical protein